MRGNDFELKGLENKTIVKHIKVKIYLQSLAAEGSGHNSVY